jgi:predicted nuclease of predicted toxin-antitoxin system
LTLRVVLDECVPPALARLLPGHTVVTVLSLGAAGMKNGELLTFLAGRCDVFLTVDANMPFQQRLADRPFAVAILRAERTAIEYLEPLVPELLVALPSLQPGQLCFFGEPRRSPHHAHER